MSRLLPQSLIFGAAFALVSGAAIAGTGDLAFAARTTAPIVDDTHVETDDSDVAGAAVDLADAQQWLAELEAGNFANIFVIENDGGMRCGEVAANSACKPLTDADKAGAIAEARDAVEFATAAVQDAEKSFAADHPDTQIENVSYAP